MFEFIKNLTQPRQRTVIVAIHGFGRRRTDGLLPLKKVLEQNKIEIVMPELYNPSDPHDNQAEVWIRRAETVVDSLLKQNCKVILAGFSMGGVIASHLAAIKPVSKLILLAPAFNYINLGNTADLIFNRLSSTKKDDSRYVPLPSEFTSTFMTVVDTLKQDITLVDCPVLIFHGTDDETISVSSSRKVFKKIPSHRKQLILLEGADHPLLDDQNYSGFILENILSFIRK